MNLKEKFESFNKNSNISKEIKEKISKLPTNEEITREILNDLKNNHTKIVLDEDIKNSYYVYLNDTIYLSNRKKVIEDSSRVILIAHEAKHSMQSKLLQKINFIISNLELAVFVINVILLVIKIFSIINIYTYMIIVMLSIIPRMILEIDAVKSSITISKDYLKNKISMKDLDKLMGIYKFKVRTLIPLFIINLIFGKVIRMLLIFIFYSLLL